jgi:hypothetical protein
MQSLIIINYSLLLGGPGTTPVDHLSEGIKLGLEGTVEKHSSVLGRDALWKKSSRISSLPKYICFHFMRFFWKATPESRDHTGVKCKILRAVNFSDVSYESLVMKVIHHGIICRAGH